MKEKNPVEHGIDLDKLDLPEIPSGPPPEPAAEKVERPAPNSAPERIPERRKRGRFSIPISLTVVLFLSLGFFFAFVRGGIRDRVPVKGKGAGPPARVLNIGPIITHLGNEKLLKTELDVVCSHVISEDDEELDVMIRDNVLTLLHSPETKRVLPQKGLEALRSYLSRKMTDRLKSHYVREIHVTKLTVL